MTPLLYQLSYSAPHRREGIWRSFARCQESRHEWLARRARKTQAFSSVARGSGRGGSRASHGAGGGRCAVGQGRVELRRFIPFALVLLLGACVAAPRPTPPLTAEQGRTAWAKSIEIALGEWQRFGGQVVHLRTDAEGNEVNAIDPVRRWEDARDAYDPLIRY